MQETLFQDRPGLDPYAAARALAKRAQSRHTNRAYERAFENFAAFARDQKEKALPARPVTVAAFLVARAGMGKSYSDLRQHKAAIARRHKEERLGDPTVDKAVRDTWRGLVTAMSEACTPKLAALAAAVESIVGAMAGEDEIWDVRDRALVLTLWEGSLTRTELRSLDVDDVAFTTEGARVEVRASRDLPKKRTVTLEYGPKGRCAVRALKAWIQRGALSSGPVFRKITRYGTIMETALHEDAIASILEKRAVASGLEPGLFSSQSFRFGRLMQAVLDGESEVEIQERSGLHPDSFPALRTALMPAYEALRSGARELETLQPKAVH